jgi:hypothetical protein
MTDDKFYEELSNLINGAFDGAFGRKTGDRKTPNTKAMATNPAIGEIMTDDLTDFVSETKQSETNPEYSCIAEYTEQTGKRFRMTKDQKQRELTREEAFNETFGGTN